MSDGIARGPISDSLPVPIPFPFVRGGLGWGTFCGAILCGPAILRRHKISELKVLPPPRVDARRPPPTIGGGELTLQTQERDYFFGELLQLLRPFRRMRHRVDSDVAGAGFDVLGYLCGDVGGAA